VQVTLKRLLRSPSWTVVIPVLAVAVMAATWGGEPAVPALLLVGVLLAGSVLAAVHHAEVVATGSASRSARSCWRSRSR
jgi:Ca2+:H+ antiporter